MIDGPTGDAWWEFDPDEKPVPLGGEQDWEIADDAELIVDTHRRAMAREDTEPTLRTLIEMQSARDPHHRELSLPRSVVPASIALLIAGCVAMFVIGWRHGTDLRQAGGGLDGKPRSIILQEHRPYVTYVTEELSSTSFTGGLALRAEEVGRR